LSTVFTRNSLINQKGPGINPGRCYPKIQQ
jgi:hypothetical protein